MSSSHTGGGGGYRPTYSQSPGSQGPPSHPTDRPYANHQPSYGPAHATPTSRPGPPPTATPTGPPSLGAVAEGAKRLRKASGIDEECRSFSEYLNSLPALQQDVRLQGALPMNAHDHSLYRVCSDSILLNAFINVIRPGTVDASRLCLKKERNMFERNNNHALAISGARTLGCVITNIGPEDLSAGTPHLVLGMLWQLIRLSLLSRINLQSHPEIIALKEEGEDVRQFVEMAPEMTLLRWFNYHLRTAGCPRRVTNFSQDIRDGDLYARLLHQIAPQHCSLAPLQESDPLRRAELVLQEAGKVGCRQFLEAQDIVQGNEKLNLAFVAQLFHAHPQLSTHAAALSFHEQQTREEVARAVAEQLARKEKDLRQRMAEEEARMRQRLQHVEEEWRARMEAEEAALREKWRREEEERRRALQTDQAQRMSEWEREQARKNEEWLRTQEQQNSLAQQKLGEIERERARVMEERRLLEEERARRTGGGGGGVAPVASSSSSVVGSGYGQGQGSGGGGYLPRPTLDNPYNTTCPMNVYQGPLGATDDWRPAQGSQMGLQGAGGAGGGHGHGQGAGPSSSGSYGQGGLYASSSPSAHSSQLQSMGGHGGQGGREPGYHSAMGVMGGPGPASPPPPHSGGTGGTTGGGGGGSSHVSYPSSPYGPSSSFSSSSHPQSHPHPQSYGGHGGQGGQQGQGMYGVGSPPSSGGPTEHPSHYQSAPYPPSHEHGGPLPPPPPPHGESMSAASLAASSQYYGGGRPTSPRTSYPSGGPPSAASLAASSTYSPYGHQGPHGGSQGGEGPYAPHAPPSAASIASSAQYGSSASSSSMGHPSGAQGPYYSSSSYGGGSYY